MGAEVRLEPGGTRRRVPLRPHQLTADITATADLFMLAHFGVAHVAPGSWTLEVDGLVRRPLRLTRADLSRYPRREVQSFHECAGNPLAPSVPQRRIANVIWGGVDLRMLLEEAGVAAEARFAWSYGLDHGEFGSGRADAYLKDLPLTRVRAGDVLVADRLNGEPLPDEHGAPARLLVPGWYGTNSVKWLYRISLAERRAEGLFTTVYYNDPLPPVAGSGPPSFRPVWQVAPESVIVRPAPDQRLRRDEPVEIWGRAWAGAGVTEVEVSVDGGGTWQAAALGGRTQWSWQRFSLGWRPEAVGPTVLLSRATDGDGLSQPPAGARNALHAVPVRVVP